MSDELTYPIGLFAPGSYMCRCAICEQSFTGDKRAVQCETCALRDALRSASDREREYREVIEDMLDDMLDDYCVCPSAKQKAQEVYDKYAPTNQETAPSSPNSRERRNEPPTVSSPCLGLLCQTPARLRAQKPDRGPY